MYEITELKDDQCRHALTDDPPHYFCGDPVEPMTITGKPSRYCPVHHKLNYTGPGKPWQSLAGMMIATEQTVRYKRDLRSHKSRSGENDPWMDSDRIAVDTVIKQNLAAGRVLRK